MADLALPPSLMPLPKPDNSLVGSSGVHFVCGELSRRGYIALPTIRNTSGVDIIIKTPKGEKIELQVKTSWSVDEWFCPPEEKILPKPDFFFVFVNLKNGVNNPQYYIVPSKVVKEQVELGFKAWKETPGRNGIEHSKENRMRKFPASEKLFKFEAFKKYLGTPLNLNQYKAWNFSSVCE
ncbi:MAG: hypothetical protein ABSA11_15650 [Candidatus Bathyarchaeia archaeon]